MTTKVSAQEAHDATSNDPNARKSHPDRHCWRSRHVLSGAQVVERTAKRVTLLESVVRSKSAHSASSANRLRQGTVHGPPRADIATAKAADVWGREHRASSVPDTSRLRRVAAEGPVTACASEVVDALADPVVC